MSNRAIRQAIYTKLTGAGVGAPVYLDRPPDDVARPFVVVGGAIEVNREVVLDASRRQAAYEVLAIGDATSDSGALSDIADAVATALHGNATTYAPVGYGVERAVADGPIEVDPDRETYARAVTVRLDIYETA